MSELDIPKDDKDCWERYPKHRWVYEMTRLLDSQNIKWSPYEIDGLYNRFPNLSMHIGNICSNYLGYIYTDVGSYDDIITEVYIVKGEIKLMRHMHTDEIIGEIDLRIAAFVALHLQKFTGVVSATTYGHNIFSVILRPYTDPSTETNTDVIKLLKRIYKKTIIST